MATYSREDTDYPTSIDIGADFNVGTRTILITYWVGVRTPEAASGYSVDCTCTDQLTSVSQYTGGNGDGSAQSALTGMFLAQLG